MITSTARMSRRSISRGLASTPFAPDKRDTVSHSSTPAPLAAQDAARLVDFARACKGAARSVVLYPKGHPTIASTLKRIVDLTSVASMPAPLTLTVIPDGLLVGDRAPARPDPAIGELAALLHSHRIGRLVVRPGGDGDAWHAFLVLLGCSPDSVHAEGGVSRLWAASSHRHLEVREIDYVEALKERPDGAAVGWQRIVSDCLLGQALELDDPAFQALVESAGFGEGFGALVGAVEQAGDTADNVDAKAAALLKIFRGVVDHIVKKDPDRLEAVLRSMAATIERMSPELVLALVKRPEDRQLVDTILSRLSDETITHFIARHLSETQASPADLARAVQAMVPDLDHRQRVLAQAYDEVSTSPAGTTEAFSAKWTELAQELDASAAQPLELPDYGRELAAARARAIEVEETNDDPPERIAAWLATVSATALRTLDLTLLRNLLQIDGDPVRWGTLMTPVVRMLGDLLLVGDFEAAQQLLDVLLAEASNEQSARRPHAVDAIDILIDGATVRHITAHLATLDDVQFDAAKAMCLSLGEVAVRPLTEALSVEDRPATRERLTSILVAFGPAGRRTIERLKSSPHLPIRRTALYLLRELGGGDALPTVADILNEAEPQVRREALRSVLNIGSDEAYRILEQALGDADPRTRDAVMQAIRGVRDERAVPLFAHVLRHVDYRGPLATVYVRAVESLGALRDPAGVAPLRDVLYTNEWWAPLRTATLRAAAAAALARIGTPEAMAILEEAAAQGPRGVRAAARTHVAADDTHHHAGREGHA
jgi:hypothetical protein